MSVRCQCPVYVVRSGHGVGQSFVARMLYDLDTRVQSSDLDRCLVKLRTAIRKKYARGDDATLMSGLSLSSGFPIWHGVERLNLAFRTRTAKVRLMLVAVGRNAGLQESGLHDAGAAEIDASGDEGLMVFSPSLPKLWFRCENVHQIVPRASEVYQRHFRPIVESEPEFDFESLSISGRAFLELLSFNLTIAPPPKADDDAVRALLGQRSEMDGRVELAGVGRSWNDRGIDDFARCVDAESEIERLKLLVSMPDRPSIALVGPPGSGKTSRLESLFRRLRQDPDRSSRDIKQWWDLSPGRMISGMSYLGQWQARLLAILRHAHRNDHTLILNDVLGWFEAGKSRDSATALVDVLSPAVDRRPVRLIVEATPQQWAKFRSIGGSLASRFRVVPVAEFDALRTRRVMVRVCQDVQWRHRCRIDSAVIREVVELYGRHDKRRVLPGAAVAAIKSLAAKHPRSFIHVDALRDHFCEQTGLSRKLIGNVNHDRDVDPKSDSPGLEASRDKLRGQSRDTLRSQCRGTPRERFRDKLRDRVVGQDEAVDALASRIATWAAGLNAPDRPIATYLLVGPTGVGKTEMAKAVAEVMFDGGGLIRIDMNELATPDAASRLVGTFARPDGLLTAAVRRRPHAVLLLDEIEKADPSVLDVLLPAIGEARIGDGRGETVDLSGLVILMTSNLGTESSDRNVGFVSADQYQHVRQLSRQRHRRAAKGYFRPEFFNRIDGVLSFDPLPDSVMRRIAVVHVDGLLRREGLQRRDLIARIRPAAIDHIIDAGAEGDATQSIRRMGARALKRRIERQLVPAVARQMAESVGDGSTILTVDCRDRRLQIDAQIVANCQPIIDPPAAPAAWLDVVDAGIDSVRDAIDALPRIGDLALSDRRMVESLLIREDFDQCKKLRDELEEVLADAIDVPLGQPTIRRASIPKIQRQLYALPSFSGYRQDIGAMDDLNAYYEMRDRGSDPIQLEASLRRLVGLADRVRRRVHHRDRPWRFAGWREVYGSSNADHFVSDDASGSRRDVTPAIDSSRRTLDDWAANVDLSIDQSHRSIIVVEGAFAAAEVPWATMSIRFTGGSNIRGDWANVTELVSHRWRPIEEPQNAEELVRSDFDETLPAVRFEQSDRGLIDLRTGEVERFDRASTAASFYAMSRRSILGCGVSLLADADDVSVAP